MDTKKKNKLSKLNFKSIEVQWSFVFQMGACISPGLGKLLARIWADAACPGCFGCGLCDVG